MIAGVRRWIALLGALLIGITEPHPAMAIESAPSSTAARDVLDSPQLVAPALPIDYAVVHRGALSIAYPPAIEPQVRDALSHVERDTQIVCDQLGLTHPPAFEIRLVPDPGTMRRLAPAQMPPPGYAVGVAYPALGLALVSMSAPQTWEAADVRHVLRHEISHLALEVATHHANVPRWLSEGIAIHQANEHSYDRFKTLAVASFTRGLVPLNTLDGLFAESPDVVNVAYAESADFVAFVIRASGSARFAVLIAHLAEGLSLDEAVRQTYRSSMAQLEFEWRHDVDTRFLTAPLWAGTGVLWAASVALLLAAFVRRRSKSRETLARWQREESSVPVANITVVTPGLHAFVAPQASSERSPSERDPSEIVLDGERHTVH